ncbi:hypothetical protein CS063_13760 [Sporanaerobium hydrogeniformans]|uniref:Uncharacterized protein n=1 Tax=Sporanaerobium hydrogeniformans TaxID=3072179 RepID=A0AC61D964_9FIRM|nr:major tail protein [Sporanaerobium hydrogeniformans]PHV69779.1 hypothetical protein CS063_13760 [Sporanaerobium hydrogeniformans]
MGKSINVKNYYLAEITEDESGVITHGVPEKVYGLMKASRVPQAASGELYEEGVLSEQLDELVSHNLAFDFGNLPQKWRAWMNGYKVETGVMADEGPCSPKPFAVGWEVIGTKGRRQMMWYIYCKAKPIEDNDEQRTKDIKISNDTINVVAFKKEQFSYKGFVLIDSANSDVTETMLDDFFKKVQTTYTIESPTP